MLDHRDFLIKLFNIAVKQALPQTCMPAHLTNIDATNGLCVLGAGKASVQMAEVIHQHFGEKCYGKIVTRHGYTDKSHIGKIAVLKAGHPIPDEHSAIAAEEILTLAKATPANIPVLFLISGGGSALMCMPVAGMSLHEKIEINKFLLASGADIGEINQVRKAISGIKGGKLAQAITGSHHTLVVSDVVGDHAETIASGPTVTQKVDNNAVIEVMTKYQWPHIDKLKQVLTADITAATKKTQSNSFTLVANAQQSIDKSANFAREQGWPVEVLSYEQQGEAAEVAKQHAKIALEKLSQNKPCLLLSGGELTVTLHNQQGAGGPNQEYLLALAIALNKAPNIYAIACDTDGIDGNRDVAGAVISPDTLARSQEINLAPEYYLANNLSHDFFNQLSDLVITGPTHTNVNDFRAILISP